MVKVYSFFLKNDKHTFREYTWYVYLFDRVVNMCLSRSRLRNIFFGGIGIVVLFLAFLYSDSVMVGFSDFSFLSGSNETTSLSLEMSGGYTSNFSVKIYNKENISMTYRLWFVDAWITSDPLAQKACLSPNETWDFWTYISGDTSLFTLPAWWNITKNLSVTFPEYYSGMHYGCIVFYPSTVNDSTVNTVPRRWWFIDALVHATIVPVIVKALPSNRVYQWTNNENTWVIKTYTSNKILIGTSLPFKLNSAGTGETQINASAETYYVVFKGQSHLASYLSWVILWGTGEQILDFTTGNNLYGAQNLDTQTDDGKKYQTAWDLKNTDGQYDYVINGNDISIILYGTFPQLWIDLSDPRNLNGDTAVNASDISIIWANCLKQDAFANAGGLFIW